MSGTSTGQQHDPGRYEIRVQGRLDERWAAWFDGMTLRPQSELRDVGLPLVSVTQVPPAQLPTTPEEER
jgi:hypothetical protein